MKRPLQLCLLAIAFDLYWTLVVLFRERGLILWLVLSLLAWWLLSPAHRVSVLLLAAAGSALDAFWVVTGLIAFDGGGVLPLWMVALWLMFASVWTRMTCLSTLPGWVLTLMATLGGPVAYWLGKHLGAITFLAPTFIVALWMAAGWFTLMLFFHLLPGRRT